MIEWIKKLFQKDREEGIPEYSIHISSLNEWVEKKHSTKSSKLRVELNALFSEIDEKKRELYDYLHEFEKARLQNPNLFVKELQVMEGNRALYIKKMRQFLDDLKISEITPESAIEFHKAFDKSIGELNKSTFKSFQVMQYFFANEVRAIAGRVKKIEETVSTISALAEKAKYSEIQTIKKEIERLNSVHSVKKELENEISAKENQFAEINRTRTNLLKEIELLKQSPEFSEFIELKNNLGEKERGLRIFKNEMFQKFMSIDKALKKTRSEDETFIKNYLSDPAFALKSDKELKILGILEITKKSLEADSEIEDKRKNKMMQIMNELSGENLLGSADKIRMSEEEIDVLNKKISINRALTRHDEMQFKVRGLVEKSELLENELREKNLKLEKLSFEGKKENLQQRLSELMNAKILIDHN